jgi:hypothetical protein
MKTLNHEFHILVNGKVEIYNRYEDIPERFEHIILFKPDYDHEDTPHSHEEHEELDSWTHKLRELMKRETGIK